jgi:hypothetical protein
VCVCVCGRKGHRGRQIYVDPAVPFHPCSVLFPVLQYKRLGNTTVYRLAWGWGEGGGGGEGVEKVRQLDRTRQLETLY